MKRLLLASTALVATAGVAAADIEFSGLARFGIGYVEDRELIVGAQPDVSDTILVSRFRFDIDGSAETDGGVRFGARVRLQADEDNLTGEANEATLAAPSFVVEYGGLQVAAGNVGGAIGSMGGRSGFEPGLESFFGQTSGIDYGHVADSSTGAGNNAVYFSYSVGDFGIAASYDQRTDAGDSWDVSATYTVGNITAEVAHGQTDAGTGGDDPSLTVLTLRGTFGDLEAALLVADDKTQIVRTDGSAYGLSARYTVGATRFLFAYGDGSAVGDDQIISIGADYDLGGGASLHGGIGRRSGLNIAGTREFDEMRADFGVNFNF